MTPVAALLAQAPASPQAEACGERERAWLCRLVVNVTDSTNAGEVARWLSPVVTILLVVLGAALVTRLVRVVSKRLERRLERGASVGATARGHQRATTIAAGVRSFAGICTWVVASLWVIAVLGVDPSTLLTSAGLVGVALGFGAQSLLRDLIAGTFMIFEDQFGVGDRVDTGLVTGTIEHLSLRVTRVRDDDGVLWHVPNGEIHRVANFSQGTHPTGRARSTDG
jgi:small conductance mechanosensitive channel